MLKKLRRYLNPIERLGKRQYSVTFPLLTSIGVAMLLEAWAHVFAHDPTAVGIFAIILFILLIIYFSFHDGLRGGFIATLVTLLYYFYIVYTRNYTGSQLVSSILLIFALGFAYGSFAFIIGWLRQKIDILLEKEANDKRRFQTIIQQLPAGVIITDEKGTIEFANKNADVILGTKVPIGFTVGNKFFVKVIDSKPSPPSQSLLAKSLSTGKALINEEFAILTKNGKRVFIEASVSPIRNSKNKIIAAAEILNDVTSQREHEKRKDDFINMASHELKTPLTSMKLYLTALKSKLPANGDLRALKTLESIAYQTDRLQTLVDDLLDVSRLRTGKLSFTKEKLDVGELIKEVVDELQSSIPQTISIRQQVKKIPVHADKFRINQVLANLITNAAKYSPRDKEIIINMDKNKNNAVVSVKDFGVGVEKDEQKKIFERLYQATDPQNKKYSGLGMGLFISREIVKGHKGKIWVESSRNKGSTFYFSLPLTG